jgi:hypothetical protein
LTPTDVLIDVGAPAFPIIRVAQLTENAVELRGSAGHTLHVYLSDVRTSAPSPRKAVDDLAAAIVSQVPVTHRAAALSFFGRILTQILQHGHGSLVAVVPKAKRTPPQFLQNGVILNPSIDVFDAVLTLQAEQTALSVSNLESTVTLLDGMMLSDGIVLFRSDAKIMGYRILVQQPKQQAATHFGGARRLAYKAMCDKVGTELTAAFIRSQDGYMECRLPNV